MKLAACIPPLLLAGCAGTPTTSDTGPAERCEVTDCFFQRDVREFEVISPDTLVVYVGQQRCPFVIEVDGLSCDAVFAPEVHFLQRSLESTDRVMSVADAQVCSTTRGLVLYTGILSPAALSERELPTGGRRGGIGGFGGIGSGGGVVGGIGRGDDFGSIAIDPTSRDVCRVFDIRSINDDQLIELYVEQGITPGPPPVGSGELEVPEPADQAEPSPSEAEASGERGDAASGDAASGSGSGSASDTAAAEGELPSPSESAAASDSADRG